MPLHMGRTNELFVRRFKIIYFHSALTCSRLAVLPDCLNLLLHSYSFLCSSFLGCLSAYLLTCLLYSYVRSYIRWLVSYSMTVMVLLLLFVPTNNLNLLDLTQSSSLSLFFICCFLPQCKDSFTSSSLNYYYQPKVGWLVDTSTERNGKE